MLTKSVITAALIAAAAPAFATGNAGAAQRAEFLGVDPEVFSASEISRLDRAVDRNQTSLIRLIIEDAESRVQQVGETANTRSDDDVRGSRAR